MDYIKKNKILLGVAILLLVLNIGMVVFILMHRPPAPRGPRDERRDQVARFIEDELKFTPDQQAGYKALRVRLFAQGDSIMHRRGEALEDLFLLLKSDSPDPAQIREKASRVGATETERSVATWEHFRALRSLCTAEQRATFDDIIMDVLRKVQGPDQQGGPGGPGHGPGLDSPGRPDADRPGPPPGEPRPGPGPKGPGQPPPPPDPPADEPGPGGPGHGQ